MSPCFLESLEKIIFSPSTCLFLSLSNPPQVLYNQPPLLLSGISPALSHRPDLKIDPERKLNLPGTRSGVRNSARSSVSSARCCYRGGVRKTKICMIHQIEDFGSKRHIYLFP